jgi:hypothetical protein
LIGAAILVKNELTGFTASAATNLSGVFILNQLPLATDYSVTCTYMVYGTKVFTGYAVNQGDHIKLDIELAEDPQSLDEVSVVANSLSNSNDRIDQTDRGKCYPDDVQDPIEERSGVFKRIDFHLINI